MLKRQLVPIALVLLNTTLGLNDALAQNAPVDSLTCAVTAVPMSPVVTGSSGLIFDGKYLWTHDDRGGGAALYRLANVRDRGRRVVYTNTPSIDWEDAAIAADYVYIGDFGNNGKTLRDELYIRRFDLTHLTARKARPAGSCASYWDRLTYWTTPKQPTVCDVTTLKFTYPGGYPAEQELDTASLNEWDSEAMAVVGDKIHLFTKVYLRFKPAIKKDPCGTVPLGKSLSDSATVLQVPDGAAATEVVDSTLKKVAVPKYPAFDHHTTIYTLPAQSAWGDSLQTANAVETISTIGPISGATYNKNLDKLILVGNMQDSYRPFLMVMDSYSQRQPGDPTKTIMLNMPCAQVEAICFRSATELVLTNENEKGKEVRAGSCGKLALPKVWSVKVP